MVQNRQLDDPSDGDFPWWLLVTLLIGVWLGYRIISDELYSEVFGILAKGIGITAFVTVTAFGLASALGLLLAAAVLSPWLVVRQSARFYIEVMRGIPMLVLLFYIAFVAAPALVAFVNAVFGPGWMRQCVPGIFH